MVENLPAIVADIGSKLATVVSQPRVAVMVLTAVAASATIVTIGMPLLQRDQLGHRMKAVAVERAEIRARERERLARGATVTLRKSPKAYMKQVVDLLDLSRWLGMEDSRARLAMAGFRSPSATVTFLFFRLVAPIVLFIASLLYVFVIVPLDYPGLVLFAGCLVAAYLGVKAPELYLSNARKKRQVSIVKSWPDALDLMLICVESGMSIENAFRRVGAEVGTSSLPLAEELSLTTAELSYLPDRRQAYENLSKRTGLDGIKAVATALIQAERYGTPLGQTLRVLAQENRDIRMTAAEKKAASLPPMLTVPMIVFFLPVLFVVIMGPALIQSLDWK